MTRLIFVRHGESELNTVAHTPKRRFNGKFDTPLTPKGIDQARAVGRYLESRKDIKLQAAITSTLSRAIDTAKFSVAEISYPVPILDGDPAWDERSLGDFENRLASEIFEELPQYCNHPDFKYFTMHYEQKAPGGENFTEVTTRAWEGVQKVEREFDGDVAIYTHGHLMRCVLGKLFELSKEQTIALHIPNAHPVIVMKEDDEYILEGELRIE